MDLWAGAVSATAGDVGVRRRSWKGRRVPLANRWRLRVRRRRASAWPGRSCPGTAAAARPRGPGCRPGSGKERPPKAIIVRANVYMSSPAGLRIPSGWHWTITAVHAWPSERIRAADPTLGSPEPAAAIVTVGGASPSDSAIRLWSAASTRTATVTPGAMSCGMIVALTACRQVAVYRGWLSCATSTVNSHTCEGSKSTRVLTEVCLTPVMIPGPAALH